VTERAVMPLVAVDLAGTPRESAAVAGTAASVGAVEQVSVVDAAEGAVDAGGGGGADKRISRWKGRYENTIELYEFFRNFSNRFRSRRFRIVFWDLTRGLRGKI